MKEVKEMEVKTLNNVDFFKGFEAATNGAVRLWTSNGDQTSLKVRVHSNQKDESKPFWQCLLPNGKWEFLHAGKFYEQLVKQDYTLNEELTATIEKRYASDADVAMVETDHSDNPNAISSWKKGVESGKGRLYLLEQD